MNIWSVLWNVDFDEKGFGVKEVDCGGADSERSAGIQPTRTGFRSGYPRVLQFEESLQEVLMTT